MADNKPIKGGDKWKKVIVGRVGDVACRYNARVGILEDAVNNGKKIAEYATYNEFGADVPVTPKMRGYLGAVKGIHLKQSTTRLHIPARPFMRTTFAAKSKTWLSNARALLAMGAHTVKEVLFLVADNAKNDIKTTIASNMPPTPNKWPKAAHGTNASSSELTGTPNPTGGENHTLIDSGLMHDSVNFDIEVAK